MLKFWKLWFKVNGKKMFRQVVAPTRAEARALFPDAFAAQADLAPANPYSCDGGTPIRVYITWADGTMRDRWVTITRVKARGVPWGQDAVVKTWTQDEVDAWDLAEKERRIRVGREYALANPGKYALTSDRLEMASAVLRERHTDWTDVQVLQAALEQYSVTGGNGPFGAWNADVDRSLMLVPWDSEDAEAVSKAIGEMELIQKAFELEANPEKACSAMVIPIITGEGQDYSGCSCCEWLGALKNHPEYHDLFLTRAVKPVATTHLGQEAYEVPFGQKVPEGFTRCAVLGTSSEVYTRG